MKQTCGFLTVLIAVAATFCEGAPQDAANGCKAEREDYSALVAGLTDKTAAQQIEGLETFLAKHPDDPSDCVTSDVEQRISRAEKSMITLRTASLDMNPDWVLPCNSFDAKVASCSGTELDTTSALPEDGLGTRMRRTIPRLYSGTIQIHPSYHARLIAAYGLSDTGIVPLSISKDVVRLASLESRTASPILIVFLRCPKIPKFRKVVWHLYPMSAAK